MLCSRIIRVFLVYCLLCPIQTCLALATKETKIEKTHKKINEAELLNNLFKPFEKYNSIAFDFIQKVQSSITKKEKTSSGHVRARKKPLGIVWEFLKPEEKQYYIDNKNITQYTPSLKLVQKGPVSDFLSMDMMNIFINHSLFLQHYDIVSQKHEGQVHTFDMKPKKKCHIKTVTLTIHNTLFLQDITITEESGRYIQFVLKNFSIKNIENSKFIFHKPKNVVIESLASEI